MINSVWNYYNVLKLLGYEQQGGGVAAKPAKSGICFTTLDAENPDIL